MSGDVERYTFEDSEGTEQGWSTFDAREAHEHGQKYALRVIANTYTFDDSELVWDFTEAPE